MKKYDPQKKKDNIMKSKFLSDPPT